MGLFTGEGSPAVNNPSVMYVPLLMVFGDEIAYHWAYCSRGLGRRGGESRPPLFNCLMSMKSG